MLSFPIPSTRRRILDADLATVAGFPKVVANFRDHEAVELQAFEPSLDRSEGPPVFVVRCLTRLTPGSTRGRVRLESQTEIDVAVESHFFSPLVLAAEHITARYSSRSQVGYQVAPRLGSL